MFPEPGKPGGLGSLVCVVVAVFTVLNIQAQRIVTSQYDNARTGAYLGEKLLNPRNVNQQQFGKVLVFKVDGDVYAQPLFLGGVDVPGKGRHDLVFVVTEHDSVYAFDAYGKPSTPLWQISFLKPGSRPVPADDVACPFIAPEIGITSTPVIDPESGTLYVLARTKDHPGLMTSHYRQSLHALAVTTGQEKFGGPVDIHAAVPGTGAGSSGGSLAFEPWRENPRAALLMSHGLIYLTWASSCDVGPYHGWVMAYDAKSLQQKAVFNTSPNADDSGIWAGDTGPAADKDGNVFVATGNGKFDVAGGGLDYGDTLLRLAGPDLRVRDSFTPYDAESLDRSDGDLGSGGPMLLPDQPGRFPHEAVVAGKGGVIYVLNRDHLGGFNAADDTHAIQTVAKSGGIFGAMSYWNHFVFALNDSDALRQYELRSGKLEPASASTIKFAGVSATPIVSANDQKDGIAWLLSSKGWNSPDRSAVLYAFDASNVSHMLYNSAMNNARDSAGLALRFTMPMVVNGHVYVGTKGEVDVYGLLAGDRRP